MNFFQHQDDARRKTSHLLVLLAAAVLVLIGVTAVTVAALLYYFESHTTSIHAANAHNASFLAHLTALCTSPIMAFIAGGVAFVVGLGSLYKANQLKRGGDYVAQALGGRLLIRDSANEKQQTLLNVVEEMAIASGTPVPRVYLLDEEGINAFAAGSQTSNAVIGITNGCINTLNRSQLQGVIAHEFSHIHHGDMKLNMRLIAVLHGILLIGLIGEMLLRSGASTHRGFGRRRKKGNNIALVGIAFMAIGFGGVFFGNIIKAAVSRQREFLADASAVQYTRNPQGIAAALFKIKRSFNGSHLTAANASEFSHFYFANGVRSFYSRMFATHPAVDQRIERIYPNQINELAELIAQEQKTEHATPKKDAHFTEATGLDDASNHQPNSNTSALESEPSLQPAPTPTPTPTPTQQSLDSLINSVGAITPLSLDFSHALLATLPVLIHQACQSPYQARAIVYALLMDSKEDIKAAQIQHLKKRAHPATYKEFTQLQQQIEQVDAGLHFPILQLALPALNSLSKPQKKLFKENLIALAKADQVISLKEWSVLTYVLNGISRVKYDKTRELDELKPEIIELIGFASLLNDARHQQISLIESVELLWKWESPSPPQTIDIQKLNLGLSKIRTLRPIQKPKVLKALAFCIAYDKDISLREKEMLRTIAAVLDCPMPIIS